jgi:hypothetical protein
MTTTTLLLLLTGAVIALAAGVYLFARLRRVEAEPFYHFRCPGCRRRLRYQARQAGHTGGCSNCGRGVTFPAVADDVD